MWMLLLSAKKNVLRRSAANEENIVFSLRICKINKLTELTAWVKNWQKKKREDTFMSILTSESQVKVRMMFWLVYFTVKHL